MVTGHADDDAVVAEQEPLNADCYCPNCGSTNITTDLVMHGTGDPSNYSEVLVCKDCGREW